jgi:hypothetical protein
MWLTETETRGQQLVREIREKWRAIALSTQPLDTDRTEAALTRAYRLMGMEPPQRVLYVESPRQGDTLTRQWAASHALPRSKAAGFYARFDNSMSPAIAGLFEDVERMTQRILEAMHLRLRPLVSSTYCGGQFDAGRLCYEDYKQQTHRSGSFVVRGMMDVAQQCGPWWPYADTCVVSARPTQITVDSSNRLHNPHGPALLYADEFKVWALHGVVMEKVMIKRLAHLSARRIEMTRNVEQRRALMEFYGEARYLKETGARIVHRDDFGTLYRKEEPEGEPLVMVKVVNSTPEPDGTYKDYFLRVPPTVHKAKDAVAWTFGLEPDIYAPQIQT